MENEKERAKGTLICAAICLVCDIILTISGFVTGNIISGMGWMCALFANLQLIAYAAEKYEKYNK